MESWWTDRCFFPRRCGCGKVLQRYLLGPFEYTCYACGRYTTVRNLFCRCPMPEVLVCDPCEDLHRTKSRACALQMVLHGSANAVTFASNESVAILVMDYLYPVYIEV